jgi:hypothetical protein
VFPEAMDDEGGGKNSVQNKFFSSFHLTVFTFFSFWPFGSWRKINKLSALYDRYKAASFKFDTSQKTNEKINKQVRNGGGETKRVCTKRSKVMDFLVTDSTNKKIRVGGAQ